MLNTLYTIIWITKYPLYLVLLRAMCIRMVDLKEGLERNPDMGFGLPQLADHMGNTDTAGVDQ